MKISQRPNVCSMAAAIAATAFITAPAVLAVWLASRHIVWGVALCVVLLIAAVYAEDRWLLGALKRWVWRQHVRLTLTMEPGHVFSRPFIIEKGATFETGDGVVYESIEDASIEIGATKAEVIVRRVTP